MLCALVRIIFNSKSAVKFLFTGDDGVSEINFGISDGSFAAEFKFEHKFTSARMQGYVKFTAQI